MVNRPILLDTHVWLWLINGEKSLARKAILAIDKAAQDGLVFISIVSVWEIAVLLSKKKIKLDSSCQQWIKAALALPGIELISCSVEMAIASYHQLTESFQGDPADRILLATAAVEDLTLITRDKKILDYAVKIGVKTIVA